MKSLILVIGITFFSLLVSAQDFPSDIWHDGKLILVSEDTLVGKLKYDLINDIVQIEIDEKFLIYSSKNIFYFEIFDSTSESYREFYVLPYGLITSYKTPVIFEVLIEGNLTLLCREYRATENVHHNPFGYGSLSREVLVYDYFFLDKQGNITKYTLKKKDLYTAVAKRQNQVIEFIRQNRLHYDDRNDLLRIVSFYNGLL